MSEDRISEGGEGEGTAAMDEIHPAMVLPAARLTEAQQAEIRRLPERADELVEASFSANTPKTYASAWRQWSKWCLGFGLDPQLADGPWLSTHLTALSEIRKLSTIESRRAGGLEIRRRLGRLLHFDDTHFRAFLAGVRRTKGTRPEKKAARLEENPRLISSSA